MTRIVAHRGWSGAAPENTMAAFKLAAAEPDIDYIELDVHLSKDGIPVVIHDHTLDRTTDGSGLVKEHTFEQLRRLDAGSWYSPAFADERIPSLEEVLDWCKGQCKLHIELKTMGDENKGLEVAVIDCVRRHGMQDEVVLSSFDHDSMKRASEIDQTIRTALIFLGKPTMLLEQLWYTGATGVSIHYAFITRSLVEEMAEHGIDLGVWTVDDTAHLASIIGHYPAVRITTNYPERAIRMKRSSGISAG